MTIGTNVSFLLKALLFILLVAGMYFLVKAIRDYRPLRKLREKVDDIERQRLLSAETEKQSFLERYLDRLDEHLTQAGVKKYLPKARRSAKSRKFWPIPATLSMLSRVSMNI